MQKAYTKKNGRAITSSLYELFASYIKGKHDNLRQESNQKFLQKGKN